MTGDVREYLRREISRRRRLEVVRLDELGRAVSPRIGGYEKGRAVHKSRRQPEAAGSGGGALLVLDGHRSVVTVTGDGS